jgi:hypothetical protein
MNEYVALYNTVGKSEVYNFKVGSGGIADCIKFFMFRLHACMRTNTRLYYLIHDIPLEKYLKLKHPQMYITQSAIDANPTRYTVVEPMTFYNCFSFEEITLPFQDVFTFSEEVPHRATVLLGGGIGPYVAVHLRLGDSFLETDKSFVYCTWDTRPFKEESLHKYIQECPKKILFLCDNQAYKLKLKAQYDTIHVTDCAIGHTSFTNTTDAQVLDAAAEFYLAIHAEEVVAVSRSGFSKIASLFKQTPYHMLY